MKKYSNDKIPAIVNLGDGKYEFCFNHSSGIVKNDDGIEHTKYECDIVVCEGTPDRNVIIAALLQEGIPQEEAIELTKDF